MLKWLRLLIFYKTKIMYNLFNSLTNGKKTILWMFLLARVPLISHHFCTISGELYVHLRYSVLWPLWIRLELKLEFADWHQNNKFGLELTFSFYNLALFSKILIWSWPKAKWKVSLYLSGKEHCHFGEEGTELKST